MLFAIWLFGMFCFWALGGYALYKLAEEEGDDFAVKHLLAGIVIVLVIGLVPIINIIGCLFIIGVGISMIMDDDSTDSWWNKPAVKKNK